MSNTDLDKAKIELARSRKEERYWKAMMISVKRPVAVTGTHPYTLEEARSRYREAQIDTESAVRKLNNCMKRLHT